MSRSPAQEADALSRRKAIYEALHPETKHGNPGVSRQIGDTRDRNENDRFTKETSAATGKSERNIQRAAARGAALGYDPAAMNMLDMAMARGAGAPTGNKNAAKNDEEEKTILDNIQDCLKAPTGTSAAAGLRRLRNAASKGNAQATERHRRASRPDPAHAPAGKRPPQDRPGPS